MMHSAGMPDAVEPKASATRPTATDILHALMGPPQQAMANGGALASLFARRMPPPIAAAAAAPRGAFDGDLVDGTGSGRSDDVVATMDEPGDTRLSRGEYIIPADVVSALGEGSTDAGAEVLNRMVEETRARWQQQVAEFPGPGEQ
jgi:hypothetical protein